jgi:hypothetical protein
VSPYGPTRKPQPTTVTSAYWGEPSAPGRGVQAETDRAVTERLPLAWPLVARSVLLDVNPTGPRDSRLARNGIGALSVFERSPPVSGMDPVFYGQRAVSLPTPAASISFRL